MSKYLKKLEATSRIFIQMTEDNMDEVSQMSFSQLYFWKYGYQAPVTGPVYHQ